MGPALPNFKKGRALVMFISARCAICGHWEENAEQTMDIYMNVKKGDKTPEVMAICKNVITCDEHKRENRD